MICFPFRGTGKLFTNVKFIPELLTFTSELLIGSLSLMHTTFLWFNHKQHNINKSWIGMHVKINIIYMFLFLYTFIYIVGTKGIYKMKEIPFVKHLWFCCVLLLLIVIKKIHNHKIMVLIDVTSTCVALLYKLFIKHSIQVFFC